MAIVSYHVGAGDRTQVFWKSSQCSQLPSHLSSTLGDSGDSLVLLGSSCLDLSWRWQLRDKDEEVLPQYIPVTFF